MFTAMVMTLFQDSGLCAPLLAPPPHKQAAGLLLALPFCRRWLAWAMVIRCWLPLFATAMVTRCWLPLFAAAGWPVSLPLLPPLASPFLPLGFLTGNPETRLGIVSDNHDALWLLVRRRLDLLLHIQQVIHDRHHL